MTYPVNMDIKPVVSAHFDEATNTITYIVRDPSSKHCAIIDSVMDIDYAAGRITYDHADAIIKEIEDEGLTLDWIIETHVHADHLSAAPYIQDKLGGKIGIGDKIMIVQDTFGKIFNEGTEFQRDGSQFDALFKEGDSFHIGQLRGDVLHTPGHTPACLTYVIGGTDEALRDRLAHFQNSCGAVPGPLDCFLVLRGTKTLAVRMEQHCRNAAALAEWLAAHRKVARVHYPWLPSHPTHAIAQKQMRADFEEVAKAGGGVFVEVGGGTAGGEEVRK